VAFIREQQEQLESNHHENRAMGKEGKTDHRHHNHSSREKKKWWYTCRLFRANSLEEGAVWHIYPFVSNDHETNNETMAVARKQPKHNSEVLLIALFSIWSALRLCHGTNQVQFSECSAVEYSRVK
jgi:hypothetical protein